MISKCSLRDFVVFLTAANIRNPSSACSFLLFDLESLTANRVIKVDTTSARKTQATTLIVVSRSRGEAASRRCKPLTAVVDAVMERRPNFILRKPKSI